MKKSVLSSNTLQLKEENIRLLFGLKVRQLRLEKNLSLADLAKITGISVSYLNEIEKGKKYPKTDKIALLADALGVTYDWLISLQLTKKMAPIAELIKSDFLTSLPLEIFGIEPGDLIEIITNTPTKINAFISTLVEIARNYDISVENFYFSVLRSYQEMHENYFEDIELEVAQFLEQHPKLKKIPLQLKEMEDILSGIYRYQIQETDFKEYEELSSMRSVLIQDSSKPLLLLNRTLNETQKIFTLGREIGYCFMKIRERAYTSTWVKITSFEQLLNNFKASYFSGALLIPQKDICDEMEAFIGQNQWDTARFLKMMHRYKVSPETFIHRLTSILPRFFGLNRLFFLRFNHRPHTENLDLDKELHLSGLYNPHGNMIREDYCRRWVSINILKELEQIQHKNTPKEETLCRVQRSQYFDSDNEYFCISLARNTTPTPNNNSSVTLGFLMNEEFKAKVKFHNDPDVLVRKVGVTCQRCSATDCAERVAIPNIFNQERKAEKIQKSLEKLMKQYQPSD